MASYQLPEALIEKIFNRSGLSINDTRRGWSRLKVACIRRDHEHDNINEANSKNGMALSALTGNGYCVKGCGLIPRAEILAHYDITLSGVLQHNVNSIIRNELRKRRAVSAKDDFAPPEFDVTEIEKRIPIWRDNLRKDRVTQVWLGNRGVDYRGVLKGTNPFAGDYGIEYDKHGNNWITHIQRGWINEHGETGIVYVQRRVHPAPERKNWYRDEKGMKYFGYKGGNRQPYPLAARCSHIESLQLPLIVVESERDADAINGYFRHYLAVAMPAGAAYWQKWLALMLNPGGVYYVPDADSAGENTAIAISRNYGKYVTIKRLPDEWHEYKDIGGAIRELGLDVVYRWLDREIGIREIGIPLPVFRG